MKLNIQHQHVITDAYICVQMCSTKQYNKCNARSMHSALFKSYMNITCGGPDSSPWYQTQTTN